MKYFLVLGLIAVAFISGALGALAVNSIRSEHEVMRDFYLAETASSVSPAEFASGLSKGKVNAVMVDLRSPQAYANGHFLTAVNIPVADLTNDQIIAAFKALPQDKPVVTYCYSSYCMLSRNVGKFLSDNGIFVKHLTAGGKEIQSDYATYVVNGTAPGELDPNGKYSPDICPPNGLGNLGSC